MSALKAKADIPNQPLMSASDPKRTGRQAGGEARPIAMTNIAAALARLALGQGAEMQQPPAIAIISGLAVQMIAGLAHHGGHLYHFGPTHWPKTLNRLLSPETDYRRVGLKCEIRSSNQ